MKSYLLDTPCIKDILSKILNLHCKTAIIRVPPPLFPYVEPELNTPLGTGAGNV